MVRRTMILSAAAALILVLLTLLVYIDRVMDQSIVIPTETRTWEIPPGTHVATLVSDLSDAGILTAPSPVVEWYARMTAGRGHIKAGEYALEPELTARSLLALFRSGKVIQRQLTFLEGWTFGQWRAGLTAEPLLTHTIAEQSDLELMATLGQPRVSPEGQFFPDTYHFTRGESDFSVLKRAYQKMQDTLAREWAVGTRYTLLARPYDALILASIVEKETGYDPDRARIASVFLNRLAKGMKLQSDPTIIYGLADFDGDLKRSHLTDDNPFNTYVIRGLPPTPICNPGLASIQAVMNPEEGGFFYFVARGDGTSEFSVTLDAHNAAVARYQKAGRVKSYRSAPGSGPEK